MVRGHAGPTFGVGDLSQLRVCFSLGFHTPEVGLQFGRGRCEAGEMLLGGRTTRRQPSPGHLDRTPLKRKDRCRSHVAAMPAVAVRSRFGCRNLKGLANAG